MTGGASSESTFTASRITTLRQCQGGTRPNGQHGCYDGAQRFHDEVSDPAVAPLVVNGLHLKKTYFARAAMPRTSNTARSSQRSPMAHIIPLPIISCIMRCTWVFR